MGSATLGNRLQPVGGGATACNRHCRCCIVIAALLKHTVALVVNPLIASAPAQVDAGAVSHAHRPHRCDGGCFVLHARAAGLLPLLLQRRRRPAATATAHPPPAPPQQVPWRRARHRLLFAAGHAAGGGLGAMVRAAPPRVELASWSHLPGTLRGLSCAAGGQGCPAHRQERELLGMLCWLARRLGSKAAHACAAAATPAAPRLLCT